MYLLTDWIRVGYSDFKLPFLPKNFLVRKHVCSFRCSYQVLGALGLNRPRPLLELQKQDPKVGAPEVEGEILATLSAGREVVHVSDEAFDVGRRIGCLEQTPVDLVEHSLFDVQEMCVSQVKLGKNGWVGLNH